MMIVSIIVLISMIIATFVLPFAWIIEGNGFNFTEEEDCTDE
jgi:hypothetical protein